jgi:heme-degrading monooxygenase HmoA
VLMMSTAASRPEANMIARMWHGRTKAPDADKYLEYLNHSGIPDYRRTPGNLGAWVFRRIEGDVAHFITLTFWESREAIRAFAGDNIELARLSGRQAVSAGIRTGRRALRGIRNMNRGLAG